MKPEPKTCPERFCQLGFTKRGAAGAATTGAGWGTAWAADAGLSAAAFLPRTGAFLAGAADGLPAGLAAGLASGLAVFDTSEAFSTSISALAFFLGAAALISALAAGLDATGFAALTAVVCAGALGDGFFLVFSAMEWVAAKPQRDASAKTPTLISGYGEPLKVRNNAAADHRFGGGIRTSMPTAPACWLGRPRVIRPNEGKPTRGLSKMRQGRFELPTSRLSIVCSNQLSY